MALEYLLVGSATLLLLNILLGKAVSRIAIPSSQVSGRIR